MKGIILAGGKGSRLYPLTKVMNKHLLPIGKYPMIYHAIYKLRQADILDVLVILGKENLGNMINVLGSGDDFGVNLTYKVQDHPEGIAHALGLAESFVGNDPIAVILGDNVFEDNITPFINK